MKINDADGGFIEFEAIGNGSYLNESGKNGKLHRGANCTSIDALMRARLISGAIALILIEWKYVEEYRSAISQWVAKGGPERQRRYCAFYTSLGSPFTFSSKTHDEKFFEILFTEPYYQLMRQTLLGWQMVEHNENNGGATEFRHLHVIPHGNRELLDKSRSLPGPHADGLEGNWKACLRNPDTYMICDQQQLLSPIQNVPRYKELWLYLGERYW